jgi:hypothetical protein
MQKVIAKFRTFQEADKATREYYRRLTPEQRLEILFQVRAMAHKEAHASPEGMARVYRIVKLKRG